MQAERKITAIFLLDEDPFCLAIYEQRLHNAGYRQVKAFKEEHSLLAALEKQPDIIFIVSGWHAAEANCLKLLKKIKSRNPDIYVVLLLGSDSLHLAEIYREAGAFTCLQKSTRQEAAQIISVIRQIEHTTRLLEKRYFSNQ